MKKSRWALGEVIPDRCENWEPGDKLTCSELYNCCSCGGEGNGVQDCGCPYCWDCHACEFCKGES